MSCFILKKTVGKSVKAYNTKATTFASTKLDSSVFDNNIPVKKLIAKNTKPPQLKKSVQDG